MEPKLLKSCSFLEISANNAFTPAGILKGCGGDRVPDRIVGDMGAPTFGAGARVEGEQPGVEGADVDCLVEDRDPPIDARKTDVQCLVRAPTAPPPQPNSTDLPAWRGTALTTYM